MKYLIEIHHGIGDIVQITGLIETVARQDPCSEIGVIVNSRTNAELFDADTRVKNVYFLNLRSMSAFDIFKEVRKMRKEKYDYMFLSPISNVRDGQILALLVGAKQAYGEQFSLISKFKRGYHAVRKQDVHIVQRNNNVLLASDLVQQVCAPCLQLKRHPLEDELENVPHPIVGICVGTSKDVKTWPLERFLYVAKKLEEKGFIVVFFGGPQEAENLQGINWGNHPKWYCYAGKTDLLGSAALVQHCDVVVAGDTGMLHIAAAQGCKTIGLFTCSNPKYHAPYGENSYVVTENLACQYCYAYRGYQTCKNYLCRDLISQEKVFNLVEEVLQKDN